MSAPQTRDPGPTGDRGPGAPAPRIRLIGTDELASLVLYEDGEVIVLNKPGDIVCHPSKAGPWSSLSGAVREHWRLPAAHLVSRLDRETSGVVIFAKDPVSAGRLQEAVRLRKAEKTYLAVMTGEFTDPAEVEQPLGPDAASPVLARTAVRPDGQPASTLFSPLSSGGGFTLARVTPVTGRKHQIRAHAHWLGKPLVGDKIYGPSDRLFLEFIETGWTPELQARLLLPRQALHCYSVDLRLAGADRIFSAPLAEDLAAFCDAKGVRVPGEFRRPVFKV